MVLGGKSILELAFDLKSNIKIDFIENQRNLNKSRQLIFFQWERIGQLPLVGKYEHLKVEVQSFEWFGTFLQVPALRCLICPQKSHRRIVFCFRLFRDVFSQQLGGIEVADCVY
jgi:hypothetical protein